MRYQGINANIMSLGGIAIAIGAMVDAAIVMIENAHKHLERSGRRHCRTPNAGVIIRRASEEVGPALFYSLLIITLSFLPVFALEAQEGRLFAPLAYHQDLRDGGRGRPVRHPGAGADGLLHPWHAFHARRRTR